MLTDDDDEILFVDYNTPDDFPTFPEAIADTLTARARSKLRILRVRPFIHERFRGRTRLQALEPISRNVAIRRSNPANRWILSTNTDMIFVPQNGGASLSDIVRDLAPGFYHAPRLEIPETLWEGLDRTAPDVAIDTIKDWGRTLHLNEIVMGSKTVMYDGPGDFQLIQRQDLLKYDGFDEDMILGWHVDSNIAKRMLLVYGQIGDLGKEIFGYHCDHTRQITPAHSHSRTENDWRRFVDDVTVPNVTAQSDSWGCAHDDIEELRLVDNIAARYVDALRSAVGAPLNETPVAHYSSEFYGSVDYDPKHVLAFLLDIFVTCNIATMTVGWVGIRRETLELFAQVWGKLGFVHPILVAEIGSGSDCLRGIPNTVVVGQDIMVAGAGAFVFDFGAPKVGDQLTRTQKNLLTNLFVETVEAERVSMAGGKAPRRVVSLNAIHTPYEPLVVANVAAGLTPFATRMRHGFVLPAVSGPQDWTGMLHPTAAAVRDGTAIRALPNATGLICYGPYRHLPKGRYRFEIKLAWQIPSHVSSHARVGVIELIGSEYNIGFVPVRFKDVAAGKIVFELEVDETLLGQSASLLQTRVVALRSGLIISSLTCEKVEKPSDGEALSLAGGSDWLPAFKLGPTGRWRKDFSVAVAGGAKDLVLDTTRFLSAAAARSGRRDVAYAARDLLATARTLFAGPRWFVATIPHALLVAGRYEIAIDLKTSAPADEPWLFIGIRSKGRFRRADVITGQDARSGEVRREFEVHIDESPDGELPVEFFIQALGHRGLIKHFKIRRLGETVQASPWIDYPDSDSDWLLGASIGEVGPYRNKVLRHLLGAWTTAGALAVRSGERGPVLNSGMQILEAGRYEAVVRFKAAKSDKPFLLVQVASEGFVRATSYIGGKTSQGECRVAFEVHANEEPYGLPVQIRLRALGAAGGTVQSIKVSRIGDVIQQSPWIDFLVEHSDWLPFLTNGPACKQNGASILASGPQEGNVLYGPYSALPPGAYRAVFELAAEIAGGDQIGTVDVFANGKTLGEAGIAASGRAEQIVIPFEIANGMGTNIETRVWKKGATGFRVLGVKVEKA